MDSIFLPILLFISSFFLLTISIIVFITFIINKELRSGIYGTMLVCIFCEIIFSINKIKSSITLLEVFKLRQGIFCIVEASICLFFVLLWVMENTSIMVLFFLRKLERSKLCHYLHLISMIFSLFLTLYMFLNDSLGVSEINSCFISKEANHSIIFLTVLVLLMLILCIFYNFWFFRLRNATKDRSFVNGYNAFIFFSLE